MKICDVTQFYARHSGGVRRYLDARTAYVNATDSHQQVLIVPGEHTDAVRRGRSIIYTIRSPRVDRSCGYRALLDIQGVRDIIRMEQPDLIECADPYQLAWTTLKEGRQWGIPTVGFYHSHFPETYVGAIGRLFPPLDYPTQRLARFYTNQIYNRFHKTLVPSAPLANLLTAWGVGNVAYVNLGFETSKFKPGPRNETLRRELNVLPNQRLLLFTGRLVREKNVGTLIETFNLLNSRQPGIYRLLLMGEGSLKSDLMRRSNRDSSIIVHPYVSDSLELAQFYRAADVFVHPGIHETFGLATLEAQACGLPVVAIRGTYMDSLALAGVSHWAAENSPASFANAIAAFCELHTREIGMNSARLAHQHYSWSEVFARLFNLYGDLLGTVTSM